MRATKAKEKKGGKDKKPLVSCNEITCPHCNTKLTWAIIKTKNRIYAGPYYKPNVELTDAFQVAIKAKPVIP